METKQLKRLFFGLEVKAPWHQELPSGRLLDEHHRHLTLAFLGEVDFARLQSLLSALPVFPFKIGLVGAFDKVLFLPNRHPNVVAWHVQWWENVTTLVNFQKSLINWLRDHNFSIVDHGREFLPHVTLCRQPFDKLEWEKSFSTVPMITGKMHLYESVGNLKYEPIWTYPIKLPFEEIEHTADIAFRVHGVDLKQLKLHAQAALAFQFPDLMNYFSETSNPNGLDEIIIELNHLITRADMEVGVPLKAVSFHGDVKEEDGLLTWEMIVDV